jgi:hypothetical protein
VTNLELYGSIGCLVGVNMAWAIMTNSSRGLHLSLGLLLLTFVTAAIWKLVAPSCWFVLCQKRHTDSAAHDSLTIIKDIVIV